MSTNINSTNPQPLKAVEEPLFVLYKDDLPDYSTSNGWVYIDGAPGTPFDDIRRDVVEANFLKAAAMLAAYDEHQEAKNSDLIVKLIAIIVENDPDIDYNRAVDSAKAMVKAGVTLVAA